MSPSRRPSHRAAALALAERDPVIAELLGIVGSPKLREPFSTHFGALARSIVYQQLAGSAAAAIHGRLVVLCGDDVSPEVVLSMSDEALRGCGLSGSKVASLRDLAEKVHEGVVVLDPRGLSRESDEEVIERLSTVRGIGRWTAEMFLLFQLKRLDIWPTGDLGVRRGYGLAWKVPMPDPKQLAPFGDPFRPYRSIAAWYCWRACEVYKSAPESALTT